MGARTGTRAMLNVRPRPLVVIATGAIQKNNTLIDPKPRTHTKQATTPISKCSQLSHTHAVELATLKRSLLNAVSHLLFPTFLFFSVLLHVTLFFPRLEDPPQRLPTLFLLNLSALFSLNKPENIWVKNANLAFFFGDWQEQWCARSQFCESQRFDRYASNNENPRPEQLPFRSL